MTTTTKSAPGSPRTAGTARAAAHVRVEASPATAPQSAPTEAEIRALVTTAIQHGPEPRDWSIPVRDALSDPVAAIAGVLDRLYDVADMRPSQLEALDRSIRQRVNPIRDRFAVELEAAIIAAGLAFVAAHPDAPRRSPASTETVR
jgi:hypothetical protein